MALKDLTAVVVTGILAACTPTSDGGTDRRRDIPQDTIDAWNAAVAWAAPPTRDYLACTPDTVGPDSTLVLRIRKPHGSSLHVGSPDGTPFLVVFHGEGSPDRAARRSLMSPQAFEQLSELRVGVRQLTGGVWVFGRDTNEVVFRAPGRYRIRVGNDMETDGPDYAECLVTYRPGR
jgi:hypothetical protein